MKRILKTWLRYGMLNIVRTLCLGIGLALGMLMLAEVIYERSVDGFIPQLDDTYLVEESFSHASSEEASYANTSGAIAPGIKAVCPEVEAATRYTHMLGVSLFKSEDGRELRSSVLLVDTAFFDVFPRKILLGEDPHTGLSTSYNAYISESLMKSAGADIVGKSVTLDKKEFKINIVGVFEDLPENTSLPRSGILLSLETYIKLTGGFDSANNWLGNDRYRSYLRLHNGVDPQNLQPSINKMIEDHMGADLKKADASMRFILRSLKGEFMRSDYNRTMNYAFLGFGLVMLVVAVFNDILLALGTLMNRAKGIATYRCYGAGRKDIYRLVLAESSFQTFCLSFPLALLIIFGLQDFIQVNISHSLSSLFPLETILLCVGIVFAVAVLCGVVPAYMYTRIPISYAYRRYSDSKRRWKLALLFVQFMLAALFVNVLMLLGLQYQKLTTYDLGFDYDKVLCMSLNDIADNERERLVQELKKQPNVASVSWGLETMSRSLSGNNVYDATTEKEYMNIGDLYVVGKDFQETMGIELLEGKGFSGLESTINSYGVENDSNNKNVVEEVMVSSSFVERMRNLAGWEGSPIGNVVYVTEHNPAAIVGVFKDIHVGGLGVDDFDTRPQVMFYGDVTHPYTSNLFVRLNNYSAQAAAEIQRVVDNAIVREANAVVPLFENIGSKYDGFKHVRDSIYFAGICIVLIALIGLIAYVNDEVSRRRVEIAIRRVIGAAEAEVQKLFLRSLCLVAVPAMLLGVLLAVLMGQNILDLFAVKIALNWYLFTACTIALLLLVLLVAVLLVHRTVRNNPTDNLRTE